MRVLILRPKELIDETVEAFRKEDIEAYGCAFVKIERKNFKVPDHDIAIVTSQNSAKIIVERGIKLNRIIAIGKKTAEVLTNAGYDVMIPSKFDSETLVKEFADIMRSKKVVAIRSDKGGDELRKIASFADYKEVHAYEILKIDGEEQRKEIEKVSQGYYDIIVFSSKTIAESFLEKCDDKCIRELKEKIIIAIGKPTAEFLKERGLNPLIPDEYSFEGILKLIKNLKDVNYQG